MYYLPTQNKICSILFQLLTVKWEFAQPYIFNGPDPLPHAHACMNNSDQIPTGKKGFQSSRNM